MRKFALICCVLCGVIFRGCSREAARREACADNLRQIWLALNVYAGDYDGRFPPIDDRCGYLVMDGDVIFPTYLENLDVFRCPSNKTHEPLEAPYAADDVTDESYIYLGWMLSTDEEGLALLDAYGSRDLTKRDQDMEVGPVESIAGPTNTIYRIRDGIERFYITRLMDPAAAALAQSEIPLKWGRPGNHGGTGANVLFMDGHVEFVEFPSTFPMTAKFMQRLEEMSSRKEAMRP